MPNPVESLKRPKLVGNFIRQKREALNLSQRALGLLFDPPVTTQFISNVERGVTPLPPAHVPTLTRALQVSETEIMSLLEKEYTLKLSGRLGIQQDSAVGPASVVLPMGVSPSQIAGQHNIPVSMGDFEFIQNLYDAYRSADPKTRQTFATICESVLNLSHSPASRRTGLSVVAAANDQAQG